MKNSQIILIVLILLFTSACASQETASSKFCSYRNEELYYEITLTYENDIITKKTAKTDIDYIAKGMSKEIFEASLATQQGDKLNEYTGVTFKSYFKDALYHESLTIDFKKISEEDLISLGYSVNDDFYSLSKNIKAYEEQGATCK
ncbi:MAG: DUF1307 domain-containing protein [Breznakia sp.]